MVLYGEIGNKGFIIRNHWLRDTGKNEGYGYRTLYMPIPDNAFFGCLLKFNNITYRKCLNYELHRVANKYIISKLH